MNADNNADGKAGLIGFPAFIDGLSLTGFAAVQGAEQKRGDSLVAFFLEVHQPRTPGRRGTHFEPLAIAFVNAELRLTGKHSRGVNVVDGTRGLVGVEGK